MEPEGTSRERVITLEPKTGYVFSPPLTKMTAKFAELIQCPVCLNILTPPLFICPSGHIVCSQCRKKLEKCPLCRIPFTGIRDRFAESFLDLIQCKDGGYTVTKKVPGGASGGPKMDGDGDQRMDKIQFLKQLGLEWTGYKRLDPRLFKELKLIRTVNALLHANKCKGEEDKCTLFWCPKMRRTLIHAANCKKRKIKSTSECFLCKEFFSVVIYHAKHCVVPKCEVPLCEKFKKGIQVWRQNQGQQQACGDNGSGPSEASASSSALPQLEQTPTSAASAGAGASSGAPPQQEQTPTSAANAGAGASSSATPQQGQNTTATAEAPAPQVIWKCRWELV